MRKLFLILSLACTLGMMAQETDNLLTTPNSPASAILGLQPSEVLKPKSFRALEAALYSNFTDEEGGISSPDNFGLEFTPYWVNDHHLSFNEYAFSKDVMKQIFRNSSFSLASTHKFLLQDSTATKAIAIGYRTSLFFGNKQDEAIVTDYNANLAKAQQIGSFMLAQHWATFDPATHTTSDDYIEPVKGDLVKRIQKVMGLSKDKAEQLANTIQSEAKKKTFTDLDGFMNVFSDAVDKAVELDYEGFKAYLLKRQGFNLDVATAVFINFPDNKFSFSEVPKYSVWATPSYNFSKKLDFLKAAASLRYEHYYTHYFEKYFPDATVFDTNFDYGLTVTANFKKFSLDFEASGRSSSSLVAAGTDSSGNTLYKKVSDNDSQYIGTFSYRLTDQIAISYQIGSAFKPTFLTTDTLISLLSLNFGFGDPSKAKK